jgi:hypothetical protein
MSFDVRRTGAVSRSPPRNPQQLSAVQLPFSADISISSSPPSRRMRSDSTFGANQYPPPQHHHRNNSSGTRNGGSAPAAPSLAASPRVAASAAATQTRVQSKPATQRRIAGPVTSASRSGAGGTAGGGQPPPLPTQQQQQQQSRCGRRRGTDSEVAAVSTERTTQRTRARKANSGASSARRATPTAAVSPPLPPAVAHSFQAFSAPTVPITATTTTVAASSSFSVPTGYQVLQRIREVSATPPANVSSAAFTAAGTSGNASPTHHPPSSFYVGGGGVGSRGRDGESNSLLASPVAACNPLHTRVTTGNFCTLPPMLSQRSRTPMSSSSCEVNSANPMSLSYSAPLLHTQPATPEREADLVSSTPAVAMANAATPAMSHHVPLLTHARPPSYSPVESCTPPMPPIAATHTHAVHPSGVSRPLLSTFSSSTLTDTAVTPHGGGCLTWSPPGSLSDDFIVPPSQSHAPLKINTAAGATAKGSAKEGGQSGLLTFFPPPAQSANTNALYSAHTEASASAAVPAGATSATGTPALLSSKPPALTTSASFSAPSHSRLDVIDAPPAAEPQSSKASVVGPPQLVLTGSGLASFAMTPAGSPTGSATGNSGSVAAAVPQMPARDAAAVTPYASPTAWPLTSSSSLQQQVHTTTPTTITTTATSPTAATTRDPHTPATVSPNPMRPPPRTNGSIASDRRPLLGSGSAPTNITTTTITSSSTGRSVSKSPTGTLSTEAAKKVMRDRRRRELYAWNEMLRKKNEAGAQDAV